MRVNMVSLRLFIQCFTVLSVTMPFEPVAEIKILDPNTHSRVLYGIEEDRREYKWIEISYTPAKQERPG